MKCVNPGLRLALAGCCLAAVCLSARPASAAPLLVQTTGDQFTARPATPGGIASMVRLVVSVTDVRTGAPVSNLGADKAGLQGITLPEGWNLTFLGGPNFSPLSDPVIPYLFDNRGNGVYVILAGRKIGSGWEVSYGSYPYALTLLFSAPGGVRRGSAVGRIQFTQDAGAPVNAQAQAVNASPAEQAASLWALVDADREEQIGEQGAGARPARRSVPSRAHTRQKQGARKSARGAGVATR